MIDAIDDTWEVDAAGNVRSMNDGAAVAVITRPASDGAVLIANAPDLYRALKKLTDEMDDGAHDENPSFLAALVVLAIVRGG